MFVCNGPPKAGTHAVCALLDTMGLKRFPGTILPGSNGDLRVEGVATGVDLLRQAPDNCYALAHVPADYDLRGFRVITILRDPRNVLVSYCRHRNADGFVYSIPEAIEDYWGAPFVPTYRGYLGWRGRAAMLRYEELPPAVIGDGSRIYENHDTDWNTRTGAPSKWQEVWNGKAEAAWKKHGGPELLVEAGY